MKINKKRQILFFVSLIGIIVVTLIMGTTFAYQSLVVDYKEGSNNDLTINVGNLDVRYTAGNKIELTNMQLLPDYNTADYLEFTINNENSTGDVIYYIDLVNGENNTNELISEDFNYTLTISNNDSEHIISSGNFKNLSSTENFRLSSAGLTHFFIKKGESQVMRLYLWLKDTNNDQNSYEGKSFKRNIEITSYFIDDINDNTLAFKIMKNSIKNTNGTDYSLIPKSEIGTLPSDDEKTLSITTDDYGVSYYYRGLVQDNYLEYRGFCYRIVRIQGDGTFKLILANEGTCETADTSSGVLRTLNEEGELVSITAPYSCNQYKTNYFGGSKCTNTPAKKVIDNWYNTNYSDDTNLVSTKWCIENELVPSAETNSAILYKGYIKTKNPTYNCISTNGLIEDKVAMLNYDESYFSGYAINNSSGIIKNSYLYENFQNCKGTSTSNIQPGSYALLTPLSINKSNNLVYIEYITITGTTSYYYGTSTSLRPMIVLKANAEIYSGNGTKNNPYRITDDPTLVQENGS